ncbi:MAG: 2-octaprenyl-6-methoxyphenyl hydroxylase [Gammaproteobacteria bacterium]
MPKSYDIIIAGGGLVGASLAVALSGTGLRVSLVEAVEPGSDEQPSFDDRTIALSRSSKTILDALGVWPAACELAHPIQQIEISERGRFGTAVIDAREQGIATLGYVIKSRELGRVLWAAVQSAANVDVICPGKITAVQHGEDEVQATVSAEQFNGELHGRLLAVCDGSRSAIREQLGVVADIKPYGASAIIGNVAVGGAREAGTAWERFTDEGPMAMLPGPDDRYTFVLTRRDDAVAEVLELPDAEMLQLLQQTFGFRLGRFREIGRRFSYPLHLVRAGEITAPRAAIIGNAAHGLHPVAGQGFNLGLRDVAALAEIVIGAAGGEGFDPGADALLQSYSDWRAPDQRNVVRFTDGLIRLFDLPALGGARGLGLLGFDLLPGAKNALARYAMGQSGRQSRLARGLPLGKSP